MPLSAEEISKRYESTCKSIQDSILVMKSCLGRDSKYNFDFAKVIGNLQEVNTLAEDRAVSMRIHALEEYKRLLNLEARRRKYFTLFEDKEKIGKIRISLRERHRNDRISHSLSYTIKMGHPIVVEDTRGERTPEQMCEDGNEMTLM